MRTYRDTGSRVEGKTSGWKDDRDEYDWAYDMGIQLKPCGCQYSVRWDKSEPQPPELAR